jgi:hypothetical protein
MKNVQAALMKMLGDTTIDWTTFYKMGDRNGEVVVEKMKEDIRMKYIWFGDNQITEEEKKWLLKITYETLIGGYFNNQGP